MKCIRTLATGLLALLICASTALAQEPVFDDDGPFRQGEGFGTPVTCKTVPYWIDHAPEYKGRISMVVEGPIVQSHWDGALAYLIMCGPDEVQVMCVSYYPEEVTGEPVLFAGGYARTGESQVTLDPCLTFPADGELTVPE